MTGCTPRSLCGRCTPYNITKGITTRNNTPGFFSTVLPYFCRFRRRRVGSVSQKPSPHRKSTEFLLILKSRFVIFNPLQNCVGNPTLQPHSLHCRTIAKGFSFLVSVPTIGGKPMHRALHKWLSIQAFSELSSCAASHLDTCFFPEDALT